MKSLNKSDVERLVDIMITKYNNDRRQCALSKKVENAPDTTSYWDGTVSATLDILVRTFALMGVDFDMDIKRETFYGIEFSYPQIVNVK